MNPQESDEQLGQALDQKVSRRKRWRLWIILMLPFIAAIGGRWYAERVKFNALKSVLPGLLELGDVDGTIYILRRTEKPEERLAVLKQLIEKYHEHGLPILTRALETERDPTVCKWELLMIGLYRDKDTAELVARHLQSEHASVRAAAADALGVIHRPAYRIPLGDGWNVAEGLAWGDGIDIGNLVHCWYNGGKDKNNRVAGETIKSDLIELPGEYRDALNEMMLRGVTQEEREAAARALVHWPPPDYKLRVAEWGVWICDQGELKLAQSVIDEIPPFVHRTGNTLDSLKDRINQIMVITKPVLHITASDPMAMDLEVKLKYGRPWFAYPRPDDFGLTANTEYALSVTKVLAQFDNPRVPAMANTGEGYPWLKARHRQYGSVCGGTSAAGNRVTHMGLRWQSLIVSPEPCTWMQPPDVPADKRFQWWTDLRKPPCAWVSSRGEAERFIYYDGPTLARSPLCIGLLDGRFRACYTDIFPKSLERSLGGRPNKLSPSANDQRYRGMFIEVREGKATAFAPDLPDKSADVPLPKAFPVRGEAVQNTWNKMLCDAGLTKVEAQALTTCWHKQFFETDGLRFLLILRAIDYDEMCPIRVAPKPTELVRVGVVLTEFGVTPASLNLTDAEKKSLEQALNNLSSDDLKVREKAQLVILGLGHTALPYLCAIIRRGLYPNTQEQLKETVRLLETLGWPSTWRITGDDPSREAEVWVRPPCESINEGRYVVDPIAILGYYWSGKNTSKTTLDWPLDGPARLYFYSRGAATVTINGKKVPLLKLASIPSTSRFLQRKPAAVQIPIRRGRNTIEVTSKGKFYLRVAPSAPTP